MLARALWTAVATVLLAAPPVAVALEPVEVPSLERDAAGAPRMLRAFYARPAGGARVPAAVLVHGCGGMYERGAIGARRIALIGWSHGGSTALATIGFEPEPGLAARFAGAIAFYPGCRGYLAQSPRFQPRAPLAVLIGEADDWTPAERCRELAEEARAGGAPFELQLYPDAHHSFDSEQPLRVRRGIPNSPRGEVHVGANPAARDAARAAVRERLRDWLKGN